MSDSLSQKSQLYYKGVPVEKLTKDKLIEAIYIINGLYCSSQRSFEEIYNLAATEKRKIVRGTYSLKKEDKL